VFLPIGDDNPLKTIPVITWALIAANIVVFLHMVTLPDGQAHAFLMRYALFPERPTWSACFTSSFLHAGVGHLFFNMLFLWIFADNVEDQFGHAGFIFFYLLGAAAAVGGFLAMRGPVPLPLVGASGAIAAVLGAYLVMFPSNRIKILFWFIFIGVFHVRAATAILFWFITQIVWTYATFHSGRIGGVAYSAHAAGFLFGFVVTLFLKSVGLVRPPRRRVVPYY